MLDASRKDLIAGGIFVAFGAYFALESLTYEVGTPFRMGPGFMPLVLGGILAALGLAIAASGLRKPDTATIDPPSWRALVLITIAIMLFGVTIRGLGFGPVVLLGTLLTAMASRMNNLVFSAIFGVGLTVLCTLIFVVGLGLSVPLIGPWLTF